MIEQHDDCAALARLVEEYLVPAADGRIAPFWTTIRAWLGAPAPAGIADQDGFA